MGAVAGARDTFGRGGLVNVDGHLDLYDHRTSPTGEAADMPSAALLGLGWPGLLALVGPVPLLPGARWRCSARATRTRCVTWMTCPGGSGWPSATDLPAWLIPRARLRA